VINRKVIFIPFCLLAQGLRARGLAKRYNAIVKPLIQYLIDNEVNIIQMPCPEIRYEGVYRLPAGKSHYDNDNYRSICREIAGEVVHFIMDLLENGYYVVAILGVDGSPSCAVKYVTVGKRRVRDMGIFTEELRTRLDYEGLNVPMVGVSIYGLKSAIREIDRLLIESEIKRL